MFMALLEIQEAMYGPEGESLVYTYKNLGVCYLAQGQYERAETQFMKAKNIIELLMSKLKVNGSKYKEMLRDN